MTPGKRRSLMMPDELWKTIQKEAARETIHTGSYTSASELIRNAVKVYTSASVEARTSTGDDERNPLL